MTYEYGTQTKTNVTIGSDTVIFQTKNVSVKLQNSGGNPLDTGTVQYNASGWRDFGTTTNGIASKELLPIKYKFKMTYNNANNQKTQNIDSNTVVVFQTVNASVQLKNSSGNLIDQGVVQYNSGGPNGASWKDFGITLNGSVQKELLPAKYNFKMTYAFINNTKVQNLDSSNTVNFSTVLCTVRVTNSSGQLINNAIVTYNAGGWKPFGTTINGITTKELLPANVTFRVQSGKTKLNKAQDITTNPIVEIRLP
jgi:hypothetical protein